MPVVYVKWITRDQVRANPEARYVFGDNVVRKGFGGQAAAMRGEPNAIGVATKRTPSMDEVAFFQDNGPTDLLTLATDLQVVKNALDQGRTVYVPADGLGTGLSQLPTRAPFLYNHLLRFFRGVSSAEQPCPWPET